jgi:hypothetical protein
VLVRSLLDQCFLGLSTGPSQFVFEGTNQSLIPFVQEARFLNPDNTAECEALYEVLKSVEMTALCKTAHDNGTDREAFKTYIW